MWKHHVMNSSVVWLLWNQLNSKQLKSTLEEKAGLMLKVVFKVEWLSVVNNSKIQLFFKSVNNQHRGKKERLPPNKEINAPDLCTFHSVKAPYT